MKEETEKKSGQLKDRDFQIIISGASTGVQLCAFLAFVAFFFAGLLLTKDRVVAEYIQTWSLALLFASAISFFFAALFYSNLTGKAFAGIYDEAQAVYGNLLSEFPGTYGLMFATPLSVYSYSGNSSLSLIVLFLVSLGVFIYQGLDNESSIVERYFKKGSVRLITVLLIVSAGIQLIGSFVESEIIFTIGTSTLWITIIGLSLFCWTRKYGIHQES